MTQYRWKRVTRHSSTSDGLVGGSLLLSPRQSQSAALCPFLLSLFSLLFLLPLSLCCPGRFLCRYPPPRSNPRSSASHSTRGRTGVVRCVWSSSCSNKSCPFFSRAVAATGQGRVCEYAPGPRTRSVWPRNVLEEEDKGAAVSTGTERARRQIPRGRGSAPGTRAFLTSGERARLFLENHDCPPPPSHQLLRLTFEFVIW
ncbi:hypothetical protein LX32DRAFT_417657 [Colletotrichum zoysiae]|uniref:Uncharacterized protein n=1 Tax=Colletotrichum zoysiae TaxID=1216348 RepID=A0AAD9HUP3_9PEZI|nr:hypothetical protein LX32DRAFT_417657 [Colletotrichum zoysiae]